MRVFTIWLAPVIVSLVVDLTSSMVYAGEDNIFSASGYTETETVNGEADRINRVVDETGTGNTSLKATTYND